MYYENTYRVGARDVDPFNQCRPSSMMDFLQEAATEAAVELHVSREEMVARYHVFWMLARIWYRLTDRSAGMRGSQSEPGTGEQGGVYVSGLTF